MKSNHPQADPSSDEGETAFDVLAREALEPYLGSVPTALVDEVKAALADLCLTHPDGRALLRQTDPDPRISASGDVQRKDGKVPLTLPKKAVR